MRLGDWLRRLRAARLGQAALILLAAFLLLRARSTEGGSAPLEERIARTLSSIEGAGRVRVTIRMRDAPASGGLMAGEKGERVPCGAVAVAQGADDPLVSLAIGDALCALLGLAPSAVSVIAGQP